MFKRYMSTIFNLSSGHGKCGVAVIRVSGPQTMKAIKAIVSTDYKPKQRFAALKSFYHPISKEMIDRGLLLWFPGPQSFTGEDSCEFQVHGSLAVIEAMFNALNNIPDVRISEPGEFAKRAFFSGKLDLIEVEGLADLIHSETEAQRKQALLQSAGSLSRLYNDWRIRLIKCIAHLEAYIDFGEDENIDDDLIDNLKNNIQKLNKEIENHLNDCRQGEIIRNGVRTTIIGAPNVGKSSFLNLMCQRKVSIVAPTAGTTRDVIESFVNVGGYPVLFADTAGLRVNADDVVEREGISRAKIQIDNSDLIILMMDATTLVENEVVTKEHFENFQLNCIKDFGLDHDLLAHKKLIVVVNKIDLVSQKKLDNIRALGFITVSCQAQAVGNLLENLKKHLKEICRQPSPENPRLTQSRYRQQLIFCASHLKAFSSDKDAIELLDLAIAAQTLRKAVKCIEKLTGDVKTDEILDVVFKDFCIGK